MLLLVAVWQQWLSHTDNCLLCVVTYAAVGAEERGGFCWTVEKLWEMLAIHITGSSMYS